MTIRYGGVNIKNSFEDFFEYIENNNKANMVAPRKINKKLALLLNLISIALLIGGGYGVKFIFDQRADEKEALLKQQQLVASQQKKANEIKERITGEKQQVVSARKNIHRDFNKLKAENKDTVAWLYVPGVDIDMPIVQGENNSYYLSHGFDNKLNSMGWAFADYQNSFPELSTNTIMYGHTYRLTTIFSKLKNVLEDKWLDNENNHVITLDTETDRLKFQVFSIYTIDKTNDYLQIDFSSKTKYQKYLDKSISRSIKKFKVNVTPEDKILTISTCYIDSSQRLVVQAKLIGSI